MKQIGVISTAVLSLVLGAVVPVYALQEQHGQEEPKARPEEQKAQPEKPAKQEQKAAPKQEKPEQQQKAARQEKPAPKPEKQAGQEKPAPQQEKSAQQEKPSAQRQNNNNKQAEKNAQQQDKNAKQEQNNAQQHQQQAKSEQQTQHADNHGGGRIPEDRYRAHFGQQHTFRVSQADYSRNRRFQYGGYWFGFVDPWPSNWLYTQNVYVIDIDGVYYLCNPMYPGVNIALNVTL